MVANWVPRSAVSLANGMVTFAGCVGMGIVYVAFGMLIDVFRWPTAFLVTGGITMVLAVCWMALASDGTDRRMSTETVHRPTFHAPSLWSLFSNRSLLGLTISYSAVGYFQYLFFYWMEYYFERVLHLEKGTSRWLSTAMVLSMGMGMVIGGKLADLRSLAGGRNAHRAVPVVCLVFSSVLVLVAVLSANSHIQIALFLISMAAVGGTEGSYWAQSVALGRSRGGSAAAIMNTGGNVGGLLAPVVTPFIADRLGWQSGLGLASAVCVFGAVMWIAIDTPDEERQLTERLLTEK
jgi:sugar phosphate permease